MFRNTKEPSSGVDHLCLAKFTRVHVKSVSIVAAYISCSVCVLVAVQEETD